MPGTTAVTPHRLPCSISLRPGPRAEGPPPGVQSGSLEAEGGRRQTTDPGGPRAPPPSIPPPHVTEYHQARRLIKTGEIATIFAISYFVQMRKFSLYVCVFLSVREAYDIHEQIFSFSNQGTLLTCYWVFLQIPDFIPERRALRESWAWWHSLPAPSPRTVSGTQQVLSEGTNGALNRA